MKLKLRNDANSVDSSERLRALNLPSSLVSGSPPRATLTIIQAQIRLSDVASNVGPKVSQRVTSNYYTCPSRWAPSCNCHGSLAAHISEENYLNRVINLYTSPAGILRLCFIKVMNQPYVNMLWNIWVGMYCFAHTHAVNICHRVILRLICEYSWWSRRLAQKDRS